jgi:ankyrin repeat protein
MADRRSLFEIALEDSPETLLPALPSGTSPSRIRNREGSSLIQHCVYRGLDKNLAALLDVSPEIALHDAVAAGSVDRVHALLAAGSDALDTLSPDGWTPLHLAAYFGRIEVLEMLLEADADPTIWGRAFERNLPIQAACAGAHDAAVELLAEVTPELDARVEAGWTALMEAAHNGLARGVAALLRCGADPSLKRDDGKTALDLARENGHDEVAALLV